MNWNFNKDTPYFVYDPEGSGLTYFETIEQRDAYAAECVEDYLESYDGWSSEEVTNVVAGVVTRSAQQVDRIDRPDDIDEEGIDGEGRYWDSDWDYVCNYKMLPVEDSRE